MIYYLIHYLLGANIKSSDCYGDTALHIAAVHNHYSIVEFILKFSNLDINTKNT